MQANWQEFEESVRLHGNPPPVGGDPTIVRTGDSKWWFFNEGWEPIGPFSSLSAAMKSQTLYIEKIKLA